MISSPRSRDPALSLPSPSVQNQIHELAKTLPPPRKQNIACDACRCALHLLSRPLPRSHLTTPRVPLARTPQAEESKMPSGPWPTKGTSSSINSMSFANCAWRFSSVKYASRPLPSPTTRTHAYCNPRSALYGEKLSMHVRTSPSFLPPSSVVKSTTARLDTTHNRPPARRSASPP
jgi:hypothetical protein